MSRYTIPLAVRFFNHIGRKTPTGCILWAGKIERNGYGRMTAVRAGRDRKGREVAAHRVAYELMVGPIPDGLDVLHRCDNRPCINPTHLFVGTNDDNVADMVRKGRQARGVRHHRAKLTEAAVTDIRRRYHGGTATQQQLAEEYGITRPHISYVVGKRGWKHVT